MLKVSKPTDILVGPLEIIFLLIWKFIPYPINFEYQYQTWARPFIPFRQDKHQYSFFHFFFFSFFFLVCVSLHSHTTYANLSQQFHFFNNFILHDTILFWLTINNILPNHFLSIITFKAFSRYSHDLKQIGNISVVIFPSYKKQVVFTVWCPIWWKLCIYTAIYIAMMLTLVNTICFHFCLYITIASPG